MLSLILIPLLLILLLASLALTIIGFISKNKTSKTLFLVFGFSLLIGLVGIIFIFKSAETSNNTKYCGKYIDTIDNQTITLEIKQNDSFTLSSSNCKDTIKGMKEETRNIPDVADRASEETDRALELRTRDRQRKLISKIDSALRRIDDGSYGYCEETGEPISLKRLDARPIATLSVEAQERHERRERDHRDD